jgi:hypothetical protein
MILRTALVGGLSSVIMVLGMSPSPASAGAGAPRGTVRKNGLVVDMRSSGRANADAAARSGNVLTPDAIIPVPGLPSLRQVQLRGGNTQVNDPSLDNIQIFPGFRPFVSYTQSETSIAAFGRNIVATYNSSANSPIVQDPMTLGLSFVHRFFSGFSVSNDGGQTWTSGFMPPVKGSLSTFGDPSVAVDRQGTFYFACLGAVAAANAPTFDGAPPDAGAGSTIQVNTSTDGGQTWSDAVIVQQDDGGDKEWLAVGPDPFVPNRDNVYVTWSSFQNDVLGSVQLRFGRSIDGGAHWDTKTIFAPGPDPNPANPQNGLQFSNPYVDKFTGFIYVPFLHFSNADQDFIRILVSEDGGMTFRFLTFNIPGAPFPTVLPVTQAGTLTDCGINNGGFRLTIHAGPDLGIGQYGLPFYQNVSRLVTQPAFAARNGILYLAWSNSTSTTFGDPNSGSNVFFMRSDDGGASWSGPIQVNPAIASDRHHVLPSLAIEENPISVHITYYTQHADETVDLDMANSHDRGNTFPLSRAVRVTKSPWVLAPTNILLRTNMDGSNTTTNFDRLIVPGYSLGEYQGVTAANGTVYVVWGDLRNSVTEPVNALDPLSGQTHSQADVFFQAVKAP